MNKKVIRCVVYDTPMSNSDAGFGSRLLSWSFAYYLSSLTNFTYKILIDEEAWPELCFLKFPNTFVVKDLKEGDHYVDNDVYNRILKLNLQSPKFDEFNTELIKFYEVDDWTIGQWFDYTFDHYLISNRFVKQVKFKTNSLTTYFDNRFKKFVGVHIRRGPGVWTTKEDFESIPESAQGYYKEILRERKWWRGENYKEIRQKFVRDKDYFKVFDKIIDINQDQEFYISTDISPECFRYYEKKYKIKTRRDYFYEFVELCISKCKENYDGSSFYDNLYILEYLFDLFALSNTKFLIKSKGSAWSACAESRMNLPSYTAPNGIYIINPEFIKLIKGGDTDRTGTES